MIKKTARYCINTLQQSKFIKQLLLEEQTVNTQNTVSFATFYVKNNDKFDLLAGYRDRIAPSWKSMVNPTVQKNNLSPDRFNSVIKSSNKVVSATAAFLSLHGLSFENKKVLEIGCHDGGKAFAVIDKHANDITAIDLSKYYIYQKREYLLNEKTVREQFVKLTKLREALSEAYIAHGVDSNSLRNVHFLEDDILQSSLASNTFDLICSWEVLEHLSMPEIAFKEMFRLLKPGGFAFHEYNPFFCENGGHSLCTLDFPFGHVRLSSDEFRRYIEKFRSDEAEMAWRFYKHNLNRMSLKDLEAYCKNAGFEIIALVDWKVNNFANLNHTILRQSKANYPTLTINDLLANSVYVLLKKPQHPMSK